MKLISYNSIPLFDKLLEEFKKRADFLGVPLPRIVVSGRIKINGTNRSVVFPATDGEPHYFQTKETVFASGDKKADSHGFAEFIDSTPEALEELRKVAEKLRGYTGNFDDPVQIYGEWAGPGIAGKIANAVENLPHKVFFVFAARVASSNERTPLIPIRKFWHPYPAHTCDRLVYVEDLGGVLATIDLVDPQPGLEAINRLTMEEEEESAVAREMLPDDCPNRVGEGYVWEVTAGHDKLNMPDHTVFFKTKGSKHKKGKRTLLAQLSADHFDNIDTFVEAALDGRLEQGIAVLKDRGLEFTRPNFKEYVTWIINDVVKEMTPEMEKSNLTIDDITGPIGRKANTFFLATLKSQALKA